MPMPELKLTSNNLVNGAAAAFVLGVVALMVRTSLVGATVPSCAERYSDGVLFDLKSASGAPLSAVELQARLSGQEYGLLDNMAVVATRESPVPLALTVKLNALEPAAKSGVQSKAKPTGIAFDWRPSAMETARSACLTYSVYLPTDFAFGEGGKLPGLIGSLRVKDKPRKTDAVTSVMAPPVAAFETHLAWRKDATAAVLTRFAAAKSADLTPIDPQWLELKTGRWTQIEEEIVLGEPGEGDATMRVFVDGKLHHDVQGLSLGQDALTHISGVAIDVAYNDADGLRASAPKATQISLSPLALRWH